MKVVGPCHVPPREIAFSRPKESHVGGDATPKVEMINGIWCQLAKSTNLTLNFSIRHRAWMGRRFFIISQRKDQPPWHVWISPNLGSSYLSKEGVRDLYDASG